MGPTNQLSQFCKAHNLFLIEDACEAVGAYSHGRSVGLQGDIGVYSFDHGKNLTCGEGGMCITDNPAYASYIASYSDHGHAFNENLPRGQDDVAMPGFNFRMTEMQAAVGKVQLSKLSSLIQLNKERYDILHSNLSPHFSIRESFDPDDVPSFDTFMLLNLEFSRLDFVLSAVKEAGFGTKNVPDAMKWHCSFYWQHLLDQDQLIASRKALLQLEQSLAIPILASKPLDAYLNLSRLILSAAN
jgi:8-amino-3,8-dideoxy-alpha-D-manno-octulosonate transaminase